MSDTLIKRSSPDDFDWPATVFLYVVLIMLGIGMCFCLKQANRLIPNRFSFPLVDRTPQRGNFDLGVEEEGLLSHYSDVEDEDDAEVIPDQTVLNNDCFEGEEEQEEELQDFGGGVRTRAEEEDEEEDEFGTLQQHRKTQNNQTYHVGRYREEDEDDEDDEDNELYRNPYKDDD